MSGHWWFCLTHMRVEGDEGCPNKDRMGPYETEEAAANALKTAAERNKAWQDQDRDWDGD
jgi:hypothetical protein